MNGFYEGYKNPVQFTYYIIEKTVSLAGLNDYKFEIPLIKCSTYHEFLGARSLGDRWCPNLEKMHNIMVNNWY